MSYKKIGNRLDKIKQLRLQDLNFLKLENGQYVFKGDSSYKFYEDRKTGEVRYSKFNESRYGDLIDFIQKTEGLNFVDAVNHLYNNFDGDFDNLKDSNRKTSSKKTKEFSHLEKEIARHLMFQGGTTINMAKEKIDKMNLSEKFDSYIDATEAYSKKHFNKMISYLHYERKIDLDILKYFVSKGLILAQDEYSNIMFIYKHPIERYTTGLTTRSSSNNSFNMNYADTSYGFNIVKGIPKTFVVHESPIDLMSYLTLYKGQDFLNDTVHSATGGTNRKAISDIIEATEDTLETIIVATDNDKAGDLTYDYIKEVYGGKYKIEREVPREIIVNGENIAIDFNDFLKHIS